VALVEGSTAFATPEKELRFKHPTYGVYVYTGNYSGQHKGGMRYSWKLVKANMSKDEATGLFQRRTKDSKLRSTIRASIEKD
jgi:hypothetical protein